jgi:glutamate/tyrosine decarboxylase-like PLP-dependent enzyme
MAVKTAREHARRARPQMVLPSTAHPAFDKASHYFGVEVVRVPVREDFRADVAAMRRAIGRRTILVVGSAPSYPQGVVDPIEEIAALARDRGIVCHVDACVGGYMLPFVRALGRPVPAFDFAVPGVTSMSVDLHKYGYAPKGASAVLYRDAALRKQQYFATTDWPGGIYCSPTMTGTRSGGAIAAAWAGLQHLGFDGYVEIAREVMETVDALKAGIDAVPGLRVLGTPEMSVLAIGSDELNVWEVGDEMGARGWHLDRQQFPASLHLTVNRAHVGGTARFLEDLAASAKAAPPIESPTLLARARHAALEAAVRVLPARVVTKVTEVAASALGLDDGPLPERKAAMYGLMASLPNRGDLETLVKGAFDRLMRYAPEEEIAVGKPNGASAHAPRVLSS